MLKAPPEYLDPVSRASEILFGLIMVLTFTCSLSAANVARDDVREMLIGALGCNLAWGIIDAFFYLIGLMAERGREVSLARELKNTTDQAAVQRLFSGYVPESLLGSLTPKSFLELRERFLNSSYARDNYLLQRADLWGAFIIFVLVFLSTFPVAIPFILFSSPVLALRVSNVVALLLLFGIGYSLGSYAGHRPWLWGLGIAILGVALVAITIRLGG